MPAILAFLRTIPLIGYLSAALGLSLLVNYSQWSHAQAAEAECEAKLLRQQLEAKKAADDLRTAQQEKVDQSAVDDGDLERETLAAITAGVNRATYKLSQASRANPSPVACRVSPDRVRVVNAALSTARASRPAL